MIWAKQRQAGFTITEMVVSLALFGLSIIAIFGIMNSTQLTQRSEASLDLANAAARQIIEAARNGGYNSLVAGQTYNRTSMLPEELSGGSATLAVTLSTDMPDIKRIDVDVSYPVGTLTRHVYSTALIGSKGLSP